MAFHNELLMEWQKREFITSGAKAARIIGISATCYSDLLRGRKNPSIKTLEKISEKTGYSVAELLGQDEDKS
ncbi:helix-turn-helix domain-containing protein [uncultured Cloacibacillus sp.]|uniref:helix-turn-helix domain-containing protein n=1 Tax=uncultured Cloacibacillus sp. TaxID=889794 RepID=UPI0026DA7401|nr:helix-turn-helix transcriptional regulator [uncultured Cloacibacillus sp.]